MEKMRESYTQSAREVLNIVPKLERRDAISALEKTVAADMEATPEAFGLEESSPFGKVSYSAVDEVLYELMRSDILDEEKELVDVN